MQNEFASDAEELAARQKRFIPINIITVVLCLVAAITLLILPVITIDLNVIVTAAKDAYEEEKEEKNAIGSSSLSADGDPSAPDDGANDPNAPSEDAGDDGSSDLSDDMQDKMFEILSRTLDKKIAISPLDFARFSKSLDIVDDLVGDVLTVDFIEDTALELVANVAVNQIVGNDTLDSIDTLHVNEIIASVRLAETGDEEGAYNDMSSAVQAAASDLGYTWTDDMQDNLKEIFDTMMEKGKENETDNFSLERMVVSVASEALDKENVQGVTTYRELLDSALSDVRAQIDEAAKTVQTVCLGIFGLLLFPVIMWGLLALLAFLHIFRKNKTFLTWYVKWTGFGPCLLFGVVPLILKAVLHQKTAQVMLGALGTTTWISGGCFIALVLLSWFWLYPARRKIRRLRKAAPYATPQTERASAPASDADEPQAEFAATDGNEDGNE